MLRPNFFIIEYMRSGTSTLYEYLKLHPQISLPKAKEPSYFVDKATLAEMWPEMWKQGFWRSEEYDLSLFNDATEDMAIGEASGQNLTFDARA